jgi:ring-1,2-phenylacetyl-CoA epoxidase subunit PaaC
LEEDIATTNIALDLIGQARILLSYAGQVEGKGRSEDDLAYKRLQHEFRNALLTEQPNTDFAFITVRQVFYTCYAQLLLTELKNSKDETLAAYATKAIKETQYHYRHASEWTLRLGDGTEESNRRMQEAVNQLWAFTGDLFASIPSDQLLVAEGIIPDTTSIKAKWIEQISDLLKRATLTVPSADAWQQKGSREGKHTEHLSYLLGEMQVVARAYPNNEW